VRAVAPVRVALRERPPLADSVGEQAERFARCQLDVDRLAHRRRTVGDDVGSPVVIGRSDSRSAPTHAVDGCLLGSTLVASPPRPTFPVDITDAEAAIMEQHFAYWSRFEQRGIVVVLGPVLDPSGTWGLGVIAADDQNGISALGAEDPAVKSGMSTFEVYAMADPFIRSWRSARFPSGCGKLPSRT
jgi:uncharacterized protein